jgi:hypothetical protein
MRLLWLELSRRGQINMKRLMHVVTLDRSTRTLAAEPVAAAADSHPPRT